MKVKTSTIFFPDRRSLEKQCSFSLEMTDFWKRGEIFLVLLGATYAIGCRNSPFFRDAGPLVRTNGGTLIGKYVKVFDTEVAAFLGIPYAEPPLGEKRFQNPEPAQPWAGVFLASEKPAPCMQHVTRNFSFMPSSRPSEDCLYLNVWTPSRRCCGDDPDRLLPVLVWVHGGAFAFGASGMDVYDGRTLASHADAVVVTLNYRLGTFGFLNMGTETARGNAGLMDQALALRWVRDNIRHFGGNPDGVTLLGESAGAISGSLHLVSPVSGGLFRRLIAMSGSFYNPQLLDTPEAALQKGTIVARGVGCHQEDPASIVDCLKKVDADDIAKAEAVITSEHLSMFQPSIGNQFLPKAPMEIISEGGRHQVDVLMGGVRDEGTLFLNYLRPDVFPNDQTPQVPLEAARDVLKQLYSMLPDSVVDSMYGLYFRDLLPGANSAAVTMEIANTVGDFAFNCPVLFLAEKMAGDVYLYWITHRSLRDPSAEWMGVQHFSEVAYVFGAPISDTIKYTPEDRKFSGELIQKWVAFARTGYPLAEDSSPVWEKFSSPNATAFELNPRHSEGNIPFPRREMCEFWRQILLQSH